VFLPILEAQEKRNTVNTSLLCATVFNIAADYYVFIIKPVQNREILMKTGTEMFRISALYFRQ